MHARTSRDAGIGGRDPDALHPAMSITDAMQVLRQCGPQAAGGSQLKNKLAEDADRPGDKPARTRLLLGLPDLGHITQATHGAYRQHVAELAA
jgi:hypothetical protein